MNIFKTLWNLISRSNKEEPVKEILAAESRILFWDSIYRGEPDWLNYQFVNLYGNKASRCRKTMKPAKLITHELSSLIWAESPQLNTDKTIEQILEDNSFWQNIPRKTDRFMALGGMAFKLYVKDNAIKIDYIPANRFIPRSWDNTTITEADFIDKFVKENKEYIRVESHRNVEGSTEDGSYVKGVEIANTVYEVVSPQSMIPVDVAGVMPEYAETIFIPTEKPLFIYVRNPEENNLEAGSPLGISMFANANDTMESLDIAFDALQSEILLGRKRIIVPASSVRTTYSDDEESRPVRFFDPSDEVYQAFNFEEMKGLQIQDNSVELRIDELRLAVHTLLDILSIQVGFSAGYLSFDGSGGTKTATEVISDNSKTFKTKQFWEQELGRGIIALCDSIRELGKVYGITTSEKDYTIEWNDSIIEDRNSKAIYWHDRVLNKTAPLWEAIMNVSGISEAEAKKRADEIRGENQTVDVAGMFGGMDGPDIDMTNPGEALEGAETLDEAEKALNLSGIQISSANEIIANVAAGNISREAGISQLMIFLGMSREQASKVMGSQ